MNKDAKDTAGRPVFRKKARPLLFCYDLLFFSVSFLLLYLIDSKDSLHFDTGLGWINMSTGFVLLFGFRLLFCVYHYVVRYGNFSMFAHLASADICSGILYLTASFLMQPKHIFGTRFFASAVILFFFNFLAGLVSRVLYISFFNLAKKHKIFRRPLQLLTFVDFDSPDQAGTMKLVLQPSYEHAAPINEVQNIIRQFAIRGEPAKIQQINKGYVNRTYYVETLSDRGHTHKYMLQRINQNAFQDIDALLNNFIVVTASLYNRFKLVEGETRPPFQTLRLTKDGQRYYHDDSGYWRMTNYIDGCHTLDIPGHPEIFYSAGRAFGLFDRFAAQIDTKSIAEIIPNFHNTKKRYADLQTALAADPVGRVKNAGDLVATIRSHEKLFGLISDALEDGSIPYRVCHNDCNLNNILFDDKTGQPVAIIDLDTVMPSSPLYDFGDSMRIGTNTAKDDETDLSKVSCNLEMYRSYAAGFLENCGDILTKRELELLPYAAPIIAFEDGIRFLADHVSGDVYYNIFYAGQNLDRSRNQIKLATDMVEKMPEICSILQEIYDNLGLDVTVSDKGDNTNKS